MSEIITAINAKPEIKTWLYDIKQAIEEIESFFADRPKIYADFQNDVRTKI